MKFLGESEHEAVIATNSSQVRLYDLTTMNCQLLSAHSGTNTTIQESLCYKLYVFVSKIPEKDISNVVVQCR